MKVIFITGSVISGIGKGTFSSSFGNLLKFHHGLNVVPLKLEGYLNYDSGTLSPIAHGEVFVLEDGTESDLDLGTYERMLDTNLSIDNFLTAGRNLSEIFRDERNGNYLGQNVQFIPDVTKKIREYIKILGNKYSADVILVEIGGTVGDIENSYYFEAARELIYELGSDNVCLVNLTYIIELSPNEHKSKAAQTGLKELMRLGLRPDVVVCRSKNVIKDKSIIEKLGWTSNVPLKNIIQLPDTNNIYQIPGYLYDIQLDQLVLDKLSIPVTPKPYQYVPTLNRIKKVVGMAGKYNNVRDSYISILKALEYTSQVYEIEVKWIDVRNLNMEELKDIDGLIVPGGFGTDGAENKMRCIQYARENHIPFLGICYGYQLAIIEYCRNVLGITNANSTEIDPSTIDPIFYKDQLHLGADKIEFKSGTIIEKTHGTREVSRRFRHRWVFNRMYKMIIEKHGLVFSEENNYAFELPGHQFYIGVQYHPEYTSRPNNPDPLFVSFIETLY